MNCPQSIDGPRLSSMAHPAPSIHPWPNAPVLSEFESSQVAIQLPVEPIDCPLPPTLPSLRAPRILKGFLNLLPPSSAPFPVHIALSSSRIQGTNCRTSQSSHIPTPSNSRALPFSSPLLFTRYPLYSNTAPQEAEGKNIYLEHSPRLNRLFLLV
jgi:hypothetical protein